MAIAISEVVVINLSLSATPVAQPGFGIPLIAAYHTAFPERVRYYTSITGVAEDFAAGTAVYAAAAKAFSQSPTLQKLAVGRMSVAPLLTFDITPIAANSQKYSIFINEEEATFTSDSSATVAEIVTGLKNAVDALAISGLTATDNATKLTLAGSAGTWFSLSSLMSPSLLTVADVMSNSATVLASLTADLNAMKLESALWYGVTSPYTNKALVNGSGGFAEWIQANKQLGAFFSIDSDNIAASETASMAYVNSDDNNDRVSVWYHHDSGSQLAAAVLGDTFPLDPGSLTFKFRQLTGVASSNLTQTQVENLKAKNANYYVEIGGVDITAEGVMGSGQFIDVIRDTDWLKARLESRIYSRLANSNKVPFTDRGIQIIVSELAGTFAEAKSAGVISDDTETVIVFPRAADVPALDKAARNLTGISASDVLAGAIHKTTVQVNITA